MASRIVFTGKQAVTFEDFTPPKVKRGEIGVRTLASLMSIGTENIVFNRIFEPGTGWDAWAKYPFYPGYACIGEVDEVGAGVKGFKVGDRVAHRRQHWSYHVLPASQAFPVPDGVRSQDAPWFALAKIAFMGALAADYRLGDRVLVIGAGPIGQMSLRWAVAAGARTAVVADTMPKRLKIARLGGATHVVSKPIAECLDDVLAANDGELADVVVDSTGNDRVFAEALKFARTRGRVLLIGDTGFPSRQHLTEDVIQKGLKVVGAHDKHTTEEWTVSKITGIFFALVTAGRFSLKGLNTHVFKPSECVRAYRTVNERRGDTLGVVFDWAAEKRAARRKPPSPARRKRGKRA